MCRYLYTVLQYSVFGMLTLRNRFCLAINHCGVFPVAAMSYLNSIRHLCLPEQ